ncbi:hypothetical protein BH10CYA1_BH10CYA1_15360 [soil metagenome]
MLCPRQGTFFVGEDGMLIRHMNKNARSIFAGLCLAALLSPVAQAKVLVGEVDHSETLQPLDPSLAVGEIFAPSKLPTIEQAPANKWYRIPDWLAGTWHKDSQTDYYRYNFKTNATDTTTRTEPAKATGTWGTQRDDKGTIWQFDPAPFTATVDSGDDFVVQMVRTSEPVDVTDKKFVRRSIDTQIRVSKVNGVIKSVESGEQITTYRPEGDALIKRETSAKVFDPEGQPILLGKSFAYENRVNSFAPQDMYKGKDMKKLFQEFLSRETASAAP